MNTRHFTVKGNIKGLYTPGTVTSEKDISGIEVQLWQKQPAKMLFLGKALTDSIGDYKVEFSIESPVSNIDDGKLNNVIIKAYYNGQLLEQTFDPDAIAYFALLTPAPSDSFKNAVNQLVTQLKADGNWTKLDRFWIHAAEQRQHAKISLVNPSSTSLEEFNSPTWTASQGYTGDGASAYLNTHFNPTTSGVNFTLNSATLGIYSRTDSAIDAFEIGSYDGTHSYIISRWSDNNMYGSINCPSDPNVAVTDSLGLLLASRISSSQVKIGKNGTVLATLTASSSSMVNLEMYLLARNGSGYPSYFSTRQVALSFIGGGGIDHATFYTAIQNFATTIGFNL